MNAPLSLLPASPLRPEPDDDIDTRIARAEQRLIAREEHLRRGMKTFGRDLHAATRPARLLQPALLTAAVAVIVLGWPSRRHTAPPPGEPGQSAVARPALLALLAGIPWTRALSHAWPLLPERWRGRFSPATAASLLTLGLPVLEGLLTRWRKDEPARPD